MSLCHADGSIIKSSKSAFMKYIKSKVTSVPPTSISTTIADAAFFPIHQNLPSTFGAIAKYFMSHLTNFDGNEIHFV